jgi:hypothetical protein
MLILDPTNPHPIPPLLKSLNQWIGYRASEQDAQGKFAKYPTHLIDGYNIDAHDPKNHVSFLIAYSLTSLQNNMGVGFVLNGKPIGYTTDGDPLYLVAIDIDAKAKMTLQQIDILWIALKKTYIEISPSKTGYRLFCLSRELVPNRNRNGLEIYVSKRFLTVTGWSGRGNLIECTDQVKKLHEEWFPAKTGSNKNKSYNNGRYPPPDTPKNRAWVNELLTYIDPDCDYETYRNVIWSIEATGWGDSENIGSVWSLGAPERFSEDAFTIIRSSFDDSRDGISFGSLIYYAKVGGWSSCAYKQGSSL